MVDEIKLERGFYRVRGEVCPKDLPPAPDDHNTAPPVEEDHATSDYHRLDEQVLFELSHGLPSQLYYLILQTP